MQWKTATLVLAACCLCLVLGVGHRSAVAQDDGYDAQGFSPGLAGHYYKDADFWSGLWPDTIPDPLIDAESWTFSNYSYTRVEPLMNHLFIRCGWFSVRWKGYIDTTVAGKPDQEASYTFRIFADDGCRLYIDGTAVIDDWRARSEETPEAWRAASVTLTPGKHAVVIEYFQGQSLAVQDHDPMKLYWECTDRGIARQIVPVANFFFKEEDLEADAGRLDTPAG